MSIRLYLYTLLKSLINAVVFLIAFFLLLRVIFLILSANLATPVVFWTIKISDFFVSPFAGIFANIPVQTGVVDVVALIALTVYLFIGFIIQSLLDDLRPKHLVASTREVTDDVDSDKTELQHRHRFIR